MGVGSGQRLPMRSKGVKGGGEAVEIRGNTGIKEFEHVGDNQVITLYKIYCHELSICSDGFLEKVERVWRSVGTRAWKNLNM